MHPGACGKRDTEKSPLLLKGSQGWAGAWNSWVAKKLWNSTFTPLEPHSLPAKASFKSDKFLILVIHPWFHSNKGNCCLVLQINTIIQKESLSPTLAENGSLQIYFSFKGRLYFFYLSVKGNRLSCEREQIVIFTGGIHYTQHSPDPCLPFQGRNDKEELFMQPCLGWCLHSSLISTPVASSVQGCSVSVGRQTPCRALQCCPDAVVVTQGCQDITSSRMALLQQP